MPLPGSVQAGIRAPIYAGVPAHNSICSAELRAAGGDSPTPLSHCANMDEKETRRPCVYVPQRQITPGGLVDVPRYRSRHHVGG